MAKQLQSSNAKDKATTKATPRCLALAEEGIRTGSQYAEMMSALMSDLIEGSITPQIGNAVCNAGGKLLKVAELSLKYGKQSPQGALPDLRLIG